MKKAVKIAALAAGTLGAAIAANEATGRKVPFLRWSFVRLMLGMKTMTREWQVGDGREEALAAYVAQHARAGDLDDAIRVVDEYSYTKSFLVNVGDKKGQLLDDAVRKVAPKLILEVGAYCGYSAMRMARVMPADARLVSVEFSAANADVARRVWDHAGLGDRVTVVVGHLGDGGTTTNALSDLYGFGPGSVDLVFLDHDKDVYLSDLLLILNRGWLHPGSVVVADNIKFPGAPEYRRYMRDEEGHSWRTVEHAAHLEYQSVIKDLVLESEYLGV